MDRIIRIGTRDSGLAIAQAEQVSGFLKANGYQTTLVRVKSSGDKNLLTPLYELGVQGIFTKELDSSLLAQEIDIAVHSLKDVPVQSARGLHLVAVLERETPYDVLVYVSEATMEKMKMDEELTIGTSSIRRMAQWKHRYGQTIVKNIRGNVNTRLKKLHTSGLDGAIFAAAGLKRLNLTEKETGLQMLLDWMVPAPGQGAIAVFCRQGDHRMYEACAHLDHIPSRVCTGIEREILSLLQGGCSLPIAALAQITGDKILLRVNVTSKDGTKTITEEELVAKNDSRIAEKMIQKIIKKGARELLNQ